MTGLAKQAGMTIVEVMDADTGQTVTEQSERVYVVAREQGKRRDS